jgi:16S rRNA (guanine527-N7)-methyltransferase
MPDYSAEAILQRIIIDLGLSLDENQFFKLVTYSKCLWQGLSRLRIVGERSVERLIEKQIFDSLFLLTRMEFKPGSRILDLGSGGGLPGIPLAVCSEDNIFYLLDANQRKISFLEETVRALGLINVNVIGGRAENYGRNHVFRESFNYILSKAVARMPVLVELALPLANLGGEIIFYKGPGLKEELSEARKALALCGGEVAKCWSYSLPSGESRSLLIIKKIKPTPDQYPRSDGKPAQKPLC